MSLSPDERKIASHYSARVQKWVDEYVNPSGYPFTMIRINRITDYLNRHKVRRRSVLDVGCGIGIPSVRLADPAADVVGFDVSDELIEWADKHAAHHAPGFRGRAKFHVGSAVDSKAYPTGLFDLVMALGVLQHIDRDREMLALMRERLADDGLLIVSLRNPLFGFTTFNRPSLELYREVFADVLQTDKGKILEKFLASNLATDQPPERHGDASNPGLGDIVYCYHNPLTLDALFGDVGLKAVELEFYRHHALPPLLQPQAPEEFDRLSQMLDARPNDWRSWFLCSTYIVYARRA